jgi:Zn finger protein HypA/HybF (possibly regulating hydrogenase expression)
MHEMSLAENVREIIEDAAGTQGFRHVRRIVLEIGELAAVETDALQFCLDVVLEGSVAEGAALEFVSTPGAGWCAAARRPWRCTNATTPARTAAPTGWRCAPGRRCG